MGAAEARLLYNRYVIAGRHYQNVMSHLTIMKIVNFIRNEMEFRRKKPILTSLPYFIKIEVSGACQLRCPGCVQGASKSGRHNARAMISLEGVNLIVDQLTDALMGVNLCFLGEPMLNPDLPAIIAYCNKRNIGTVFPTNLSVKLSREDIENIVSSGLDKLVVCIDGVTQEVYQVYRKGGILRLVLENASALIAAKRRLRSRNPLMEFKFILFDHNREQMDEARKLASTMGFDRFSVVRDNASPVTSETLKRVRSRNLAEGRACFWPWSSSVIRWDGTVLPCCRNNSVMGNIFEEDFRAIWNNDRYQRLRSFHRTHVPDELSETCVSCMHF